MHQMASEPKHAKRIDQWESFDELPEAARNSIEAGLRDADAGRLTPHEQVMQKMRARFKAFNSQTSFRSPK